MAQLLFEFTSHQIEAVAAAITEVITGGDYRCEMAQEYVDYEPCSSFENGLKIMRNGKAVSVVVTPTSSNIRYALLNAPRFGGGQVANVVWNDRIHTY